MFQFADKVQKDKYFENILAGLSWSARVGLKQILKPVSNDE